MTRLTKNFNFISEDDEKIFKEVANLEKRFIDKDFEVIPSIAGKIIELAFIEKMEQPERQGLNNYLMWYKEMFGEPIVLDALYIVKKYRNDSSHAISSHEEISWTSALWIVRSVSMILQNFYLSKPTYQFTEMPYLNATQQQQIVSNQMVTSTPVSVNESELSIKKTPITEWLESDKIQFKIPYYQRSYTWKDSQIETLINDIESRIEDRFQHYFGVIAIKKEQINNSNIQCYKIIDGQQRLTTSILLFKAAHDALQTKGFKGIDVLSNIFNTNISSRYLNDSATDGAKSELRDILTKNFGLNKKFEWQYGKNYQKFYEYFNSKTYSSIQDFVLAFASKFEIAMLQYDIESDREMDVFENMNSKGTELEEWDLIRNHLLNISDRSVSDSDKVKLMERYFLNDMNSNLSDSSKVLAEFFTEYFYLKASYVDDLKWVSFDRFPIYNNFKLFTKGKKLSISDYEDLLKELWSFGIIHRSLEFGDFSSLNIFDGLTVTRLKDISKKQQLYYLIFKIVATTSEWKDNSWHFKDKKMFEDLISLIHSAVIRIEITTGNGTSFRLPTINLSKFIDGKNNINIIKAIVKTSETLYVSDNAVEQALLNGSLKNELARNLLLLVNNFLIDQNKNGVKVEFIKPTLEHVMPKENEKWETFLKTQSKTNWKVEFDNRLGRIGNFYVLPQKLNSKISNSTFDIKKPEILKMKTPEIMGSDEHGITGLLAIESWTFKLIDARTKELTKLLLKLLKIS